MTKQIKSSASKSATSAQAQPAQVKPNPKTVKQRINQGLPGGKYTLLNGELIKDQEQ